MNAINKINSFELLVLAAMRSGMPVRVHEGMVWIRDSVDICYHSLDRCTVRLHEAEIADVPATPEEQADALRELAATMTGNDAALARAWAHQIDALHAATGAP